MDDWIKEAVRNKGALHRALGIPSDDTVTRWQGDTVTNPDPGHLVTPSPCHLVRLNRGSRNRKRGGS